MKDPQENMDALIRENTMLKEMILKDQNWYLLRQSCNVLFNTIPTGIIILDTDGRFAFVNQVAADQLLFPIDQIIGMKVSDILGEVDATIYLEKIFKPILSDGGDINSKTSVRRGTKKYSFEYHCAPIRDEAGGIIGILNMTHDVTQEEKRRKYFQIQENVNFISFQAGCMKETIKMIFELMCQIDCINSGGFYIFDEKKQLMELVHHYNLPDDFVNHVRSYGTDSVNYKIIVRGVPQYDIISELSADTQKINESLGIKLVAAIPLIHENQVIGCITLNINESEDFFAEDKTFIESLAWRMARMIALMRACDKFLDANSELQDKISQLKDNQQMLIQKSRMESMGELAAGMAHEINQPLIVISLSMENIMQKMTAGQKNLSPPYLQKKFDSILHNIARIQQIIDNMRIFARDQSSIIFEKVNINDVIEKSLSMVRAQYRGNGIKLSFDQVDPKLHVLGNFFKLEQVIMNLLSNSRYAVNQKDNKTGFSSFQKEIKLQVSHLKNKIFIEVWDNGIGIPEEDIDKLFTPFFTTKMEGEGTGLGLPIVYGIVKELKGDIRVKSKPDEFTSIEITLPAV